MINTILMLSDLAIGVLFGGGFILFLGFLVYLDEKYNNDLF